MVSLSWEECSCILKQLQHAAHIVHNDLCQVSSSSAAPSNSDSNRGLKTLLAKILSCLQRFRRAIDASFLQDDHQTTNHFEPHSMSASLVIQTQLEQITKLLVTIQVYTGCEIPTIKSIQDERHQNIQLEVAAVAQLDAVLSRNNLPAVSFADKERLRILISRLRQQEQQLAFHRDLLKAQQDLGGPSSEYSVENFAYGNTPFPTWLNLFTQPSVLDVIASKAQQTTLTVFGSSSGSLVFFAVLVLGLSCVGVEMLPFLHDVAERTRCELQLTQDNCRFKCADMLTVSVEKTSILLLTSQCWDAALSHQVHTKLASELQPGTIVLDYKNSLQTSQHFTLLQQLSHQRVSWTESQSLYIFQRIGDQDQVL